VGQAILPVAHRQSCLPDITKDEADVLVSKRREREEKSIPWEQVEAALAEFD